jgi:uncharacterized phage protein (TIGR01671 family)
MRNTYDICFRAWDDKEKEMYHDINLYADNWVGCKIDEDKKIMIPPSQIKVMQWTGLLDKNHKSIYEGDIVKYLDELDGETELFGFVEWERCWWSVNLHPDFLRENDIMDTDEYLTYEVVGNIYENKDMIYWIK